MGKIQIDHTGSGGGITLSSDGTSLLVGGTAVGGGDLVDDTSPQLGGDLDLNGNAITSSNQVTIKETSGNGVFILSNNQGVIHAYGGAFGGVYLRHNNDTKFKVEGGNITTDGGADFTFEGASYNAVWDASDNALEFADNAKIKLGNGSDLQIYHDATDNHIDYSSKLNFTPSGGADLRFNGTSYETDWLAVGHWHFKDNTQARFGNSDDLQIYHSSSDNHSYIKETGSGNLRIMGQNLRLQNASGADYLEGISGGAVNIMHNSNTKLATTSSGIQTTGTVNVNGAYTLPTSDGSANQVLTTNGSGAVTFADAAVM